MKPQPHWEGIKFKPVIAVGKALQSEMLLVFVFKFILFYVITCKGQQKVFITTVLNAMEAIKSHNAGSTFTIQ